jgi:hypothetical protein
MLNALGMSPNPSFVRLRELARLLGLPITWLRAEAAVGRIPSILAGRRRVFDPDAVRRALAERQTGGGR